MASTEDSPRKRQRTAGAMVGGVDDNSISKDVSDGAHVNDENAPASDRSERGVLQEKLKHIIKGGELELEERIEKMTEKVKMFTTKIENDFALQIMRLPKHVQSMPMEEFKRKYNCDVRAVIRDRATSATSRLGGATRVFVPQTPSVNMATKPLAAFSAIKTSFVRRQRRVGNEDESNATKGDDLAIPKIELELTDAVTGKNIDASDPEAAKNLTDESKQEVLSHLSSLQSQISALMEQFQ
jgi:hypothetical protein